MTRSHKHNDRDHSLISSASLSTSSSSSNHSEHISQAQHLPRYFGKAGHADADPKKTKKDGGGKANWGRPGSELDDSSYNPTHPRRRSNSSIDGAATASAYRSKFEEVEEVPVFDEELHGVAGFREGGEHGGMATDMEEVVSGLERKSTHGSEESVEGEML